MNPERVVLHSVFIELHCNNLLNKLLFAFLNTCMAKINFYVLVPYQIYISNGHGQ